MSDGIGKNDSYQLCPMIQTFVTLGALSHIGKERSSNQDSFCALAGADAPPGIDALLAVADGMGGHKAGEVASEMAVQILITKLSRDYAAVQPTNDILSALKRAIGELNAEIHMAAARPQTRGMGTTLTVAAIVGSTLAIGHVGDSRAYLLRDDRIRQLTQDHSWVGDQMARGLITRRDAEIHPWRNILTQAIGVDPSIDVNSVVVEISNSDLLLICSDGVHSLIRDDELASILTDSADPQSSCREIVDLANAKGGNDNITVVVGRIDSRSTDSE